PSAPVFLQLAAFLPFGGFGSGSRPSILERTSAPDTLSHASRPVLGLPPSRGQPNLVRLAAPEQPAGPVSSSDGKPSDCSGPWRSTEFVSQPISFAKSLRPQLSWILAHPKWPVTMIQRLGSRGRDHEQAHDA